MAITFRLENNVATSTVDLTSGGNIQLLPASLERPLSYQTPGETITQTLSFKATGTSKSNARSNVNAFIALLRSAKNWVEDVGQSDSIWLRMAADGERAVRMLVLDYDIVATTPIPGIDPMQSLTTDIFFDLVLVLRNQREEAAYTSGTGGVSAGPGALGYLFNWSNLANTAPSRIKTILSSTLATGSITKMWIGLKQYTGANFQYIWKIEDADAYANETTTPAEVIGSYGRAVSLTTFADAVMEHRVVLSCGGVYDAAGVLGDVGSAKGEYVGLLRYQISTGIGDATVLAKMGTAYISGGEVAYNEPRLLNDDGNWHFASLGVVRFPPRGNRYETDTFFEFDNVSVYLAAQRLSGTRNLYMDSITWIPYKHFLSLENVKLDSSTDVYIVTHEDGQVEAFNFTTITEGYGTITEQKSWLFPKMDFTILEGVLAGERADSQVYNDNMSFLSWSIYEAFEGYNG